jgi:NAD(P)-dependent dehydrogenase (short-subunit alcohol dehydrogenase family)
MDNSSSRPPALVTGASTAIGLEPAAQLAGNGLDLVVTARSDGLGDAVRFVPDSAKAEQHRKTAEPGSARTS